MQNKKSTIVMLVIVIIGAVAIMLNQSIINIALPQIMSEYSISADTAQWLVTGFMLISGILVPVSAFLVKRFSYKQLFIAAMAFFATGSFVCFISQDFTVLMIGRMLQAVSGGMILPLAMNIVTAVFPLEKRGSMMGILGLSVVFAPAVAPTLSGWFIEYYDWHLLFAIMAAIGTAVLVLGIFAFTYKSEREKAKLDTLSVILSSIGFGGLLYGVSEASSRGWGDTVVIISLIVATVSVVAFILYSLKRKDPLLEIRVFKNLNFSYTSIVSIVLQISLFGAMILLPIFLQTVRGFTPMQAGLLILPGAIIMGVMGVFTGKLYDKFGIKPLAIFGTIVLTITTYFLSNLSMETSYAQIMLLYTIRSFGMSFIMMPITAAGLATIDKRMLPHANALSNTLRTIAGAVGTAILVSIMTSSANQYLSDLGGNLTADSARLAMIHGINTAFLVSTAISAATIVMSFFFKRYNRTSDAKTQANESPAILS